MRWIVGLLLFLLVTGEGRTQQVFHFRYQPPGQQPGTGLLVLQHGRMGFIRLELPRQGKPVLYDLQLQPSFSTTLRDGRTGDSLLFIRAFVWRSLRGEGDPGFSDVDCWFTWHARRRRFELSAVRPLYRINWEPIGRYLLSIQPEPLRAGETPEPAGVFSAIETAPAGPSLPAHWLRRYFLPEEQRGHQGRIAELLRVREKRKPVIHFIALHGKEPLCQKDVNAFAEWIQAVGINLHLSVRSYFLGDEKFSLTALRHTLHEMRVGPDDIILFTYSGHGFSFQDEPDRLFPQLALWHTDRPTQALVRANTINLEEVYQEITAKKARFNLVLGDCCNSLIEMHRLQHRPSGAGVFPASPLLMNPRAVSNLFLETRASYLLAATTKGELAGSHPWYGGFFSYSFLEVMKRGLYYANPSTVNWSGFFPQIRSKAAELSAAFTCQGSACRQTMISREK